MNQSVSERLVGTTATDQSENWYAAKVADIARLLDVDPSAGLPETTAASRRASSGPNRLAEQPA